MAKSIWGPTRLAILALLVAAPLAAQNHVSGTLTVDGKAVKLTHVYAFATPGFFDPKTQDVVVVLCDDALPPAAVRDELGRADLIKAGKLHCVEQTIGSSKQVINYKVQHGRFRMPETGGSTEHVFTPTTLDGKTIAGRSWTKSPQKSFDDVPYSYDATFSAAIAPRQ
jgi:hypothetical protein